MHYHARHVPNLAPLPTPDEKAKVVELLEDDPGTLDPTEVAILQKVLRFTWAYCLYLQPYVDEKSQKD